MIIGISGKMGTGKDYIANEIRKLLLENNKSVIMMAFADQMKIDCIVNGEVEYERVYVMKDEKSRKILQDYGMERRIKNGADYWIKYIENWIRVYKQRGVECIIITDVRFLNEAEMIHRMGGKLIRIEASKRNRDKLLQEKSEQLAGHISECCLDAYYGFDIILKNDYDDIMDLEG